MIEQRGRVRKEQLDAAGVIVSVEVLGNGVANAK